MFNFLLRVAEWEQMKKAAGRDIPLTCCLVEDDIEKWSRYQGSGITRIIVEVHPDTADNVLPKLDKFAKGLAGVYI